MASVKAKPTAVEERLKQLRDELYKLHEAMLEAEQSVLNDELTQPASAKESVEAKYHDPASGWLRELLAIVTQFDAVLGGKVSREDTTDLVEQTRALMLPEETGLPAERSPMEKVTSDPRVATAQSHILDLLNALESYRQ